MRSVLAHLARFGHRLSGRASAIRVFDGCFATHDAVIPWAHVTRVLAWQAGGELRIDVHAANPARRLTLAEGQPGFDAFVRMADRRLVFPLAWWEAVPAERRVLLYELPQPAAQDLVPVLR